jgi:hypothetical protein
MPDRGGREVGVKKQFLAQRRLVTDGKRVLVRGRENQKDSDQTATKHGASHDGEVTRIFSERMGGIIHLLLAKSN